MITNNFKNSELGPIPNEWEVKTLGEICLIFGRIGFRGYTIKDIVEQGLGAITLSPSNIKNGKMDYSNCTYISWFKYNESPEIKIYNDDIIMVKTGSTFGKVAIVKNLKEPATINPQFIVLKKVTCDNDYLSYLMQSSLFQNQIQMDVEGGAIPTMSQAKISKFHLPLPPLPEQRRIAAALSDIDALIANLDALIDKKRLIKQATMQQLLTGKRRIEGFKDKWVEKKLGDCCEIYRGGSPRPIEAFLTNIGINWIKIGDVSENSKYITQTEEKITEEGAKHSRFVHKGDFILSNSMSFGRPYILQIDGCIHDGWLVIQNYQKNFETVFLYYLLGSDIVFMQYVSMAAGSSVQNLNKEKVANVYLNVPPTLAEQTAISKILSDMDDEISLLETKKAKYTALKQGMMSELLSGRIRI